MSTSRLSHFTLLVGLLSLLVAGVASAQAPRHAVAPAPAAAPAAPAATPTTIAVINGKLLSAEALYAGQVEGYARHVFETLLHRRLIFDAAARAGIVLGKTEMAETVAAAKEKLVNPSGPAGAAPSDAQFQAALHREGVSEGWFLAGVKTDLLLDKLVAKRGSLSDDEIAAYYEQHKSDFVKPAEVYLWDFSAADMDKVAAAGKQLNAGTESPTPDNPPVAAEGESVSAGWRTRAEISEPLLSDTAFTLEVGQASNPMQVGAQYHVLYVSDAQPGVRLPPAQARPQIVAALRQQKGLTREAVLESLVRGATIQVNWQPLAYLNDEYQAVKAIRIVVDGQPVLLPRPALMLGGRLMMPVKPVASALGARLAWQAKTSTLTADRAGHTLTLVVGKPVMLVNGHAAMVAPPRLDGATLMVEARPFLEALGATVQYEAGINTLYVKSGK